MKIDLAVLSKQDTEATNGAKKMRLSENAASMVFQLFTKNVYSNPIGTVVREITSNCFDSHIEAGVDKPVLIKKSFDEETETHYISFVDYGVGMSPDRIENIYMVYFESSKRDTNDQIGGFGIGGKTPLAYKRVVGQGEGEYENMFYVITNYEGTKYYYCIYEGAQSPEVSLLHSEPTKEHNGTEVRIPILEKDLSAFKREMVKQLYYFENIIFEGFDNTNSYGDVELTNDYQIVTGKSFWFRGTEYNNNIHVCLGRVAYPIDYSAIDEDSYNFNLPVAIKLEVGDISVTASRESLDYSEQTIKLLKKKLVEVKQELTDRLKKQYENVQSLTDYFKVKEEFGKLQLTDSQSIYIKDTIKAADVDYSNFKYNSIQQMPSDSNLFDLLFDVKLYGKKESSRGYHRSDYFQGSYKGLLNSGSNIFHVDDIFHRKVVKQAYLREQCERFYIIKKVNVEEAMHLSDICSMFNVNLDSKYDEDDKGNKTLKDFIVTLKEIQEDYFEIVQQYSENYDKVEVPEDFIEDRKNARLSLDILKSTIPVKFIEKYYRSTTRVKVKDLVWFKGLIVYGHSDDAYQLSQVKTAYSVAFENPKTISDYSTWNDEGFGKNPKGIIFMTIAKNNAKYMAFCKKAIHVKDAYHTLLHRRADFIMKHFMSYELVSKFDEVEDMYKSPEFARLSANWSKRIQAVKKVVDAIPKNATKIQSYKSELSRFYDINNIKVTDEHKKLINEIDKVLKLQQKNEKVLGYINSYRDLSDADDTLMLILAKVMTFK